jgi:hypothetical protein
MQFREFQLFEVFGKVGEDFASHFAATPVGAQDARHGYARGLG